MKERIWQLLATAVEKKNPLKIGRGLEHTFKIRDGRRVKFKKRPWE